MTEDCAQADPESWFPEKGGSNREAKRICMGCSVLDECLAYALETNQQHGVWGGLSERERRKLKEATVSEEFVPCTRPLCDRKPRYSGLCDPCYHDPTVDDLAVHRALESRDPAGLNAAERGEVARLVVEAGGGASLVAKVLRCNGRVARTLTAEAKAVAA